MKASLSKCFEETEIDGIVDAVISNDTSKLAELISKSQEAYKKKVQDEAKKEFSKSAKIPGGNGGDDDSDENTKLIKELAEAQSKGNKATHDNKAWDNYKNRH